MGCQIPLGCMYDCQLNGALQCRYIRDYEINLVMCFRAAATRCREKRKMWITALEKKAEEMSELNSHLQVSYGI